MNGNRPAPSWRSDANASGHFNAGSALSEFMAGRLGAPGCWPEENRRTSILFGARDEVSSIQRWENDGGKTIAAAASAKDPASALPHFHSNRPLLTQLI
jgi:hypothetical protein